MVQKGNEIWSPSHSDKPKTSSFSCMSIVFVINIQNHKSGESDCWEYFTSLLKYLDLYRNFVLKSCVQAHLAFCSQIMSPLSNIFCIQRAILTLRVDKTALPWVSSAISFPLAHIATQQISKEFLQNLLNISRILKNSWGC